MEKFDGKRLLVLGSNVGSVDIVKYAKANGAYTIVADYLAPDKSPAKLVADENVLISTSDTEELKELIRNKGINGVLAGVSEYNLLKSMELCENFGFPFYCNREQWELIENKDSFRNLCIKYSIPCPRTYFIGTDITEDVYKKLIYPLVIKPIDASASLGVFICSNERELREVVQKAIEASISHKIIIEDFFVGEEFTAHYTIANGDVTLSCMDNRYPVSVNEGMVTTIPVARIYPSAFLCEYLHQVNEHVLDMCKSLRVTNGVLFVQGLYNKKQNCFSIFEGGLRSAGEAPYRFIEEINGNNFMNNMVDYSLLGRSDGFDLSREDPFLRGKACGVISFVSKGGRVGKIIGLKKAIREVKSIRGYEIRYPEGTDTPTGNTLRQLMIRFVMISENFGSLARDIRFINDNVIVLNDKGKDMCLKFNPDMLLN